MTIAEKITALYNEAAKVFNSLGAPGEDRNGPSPAKLNFSAKYVDQALTLYSQPATSGLDKLVGPVSKGNWEYCIDNCGGLEPFVYRKRDDEVEYLRLYSFAEVDKPSEPSYCFTDLKDDRTIFSDYQKANMVRLMAEEGRLSGHELQARVPEAYAKASVPEPATDDNHDWIHAAGGEGPDSDGYGYFTDYDKQTEEHWVYPPLSSFLLFSFPCSFPSSSHRARRHSAHQSEPAFKGCGMVWTRR